MTMSLLGYIKKGRPANWTTTPSGMKQLQRENRLTPRQKPISRISANKKKSDRLYMAISKAHRAKAENSFCRVHFALTGEKIPATHIHHIRGRSKTLKFDTRFFCPTTFANSLWPHHNIDKARSLGLIAQVGDWNREPDDQETQRIRDWMAGHRIY